MSYLRCSIVLDRFLFSIIERHLLRWFMLLVIFPSLSFGDDKLQEERFLKITSDHFKRITDAVSKRAVSPLMVELGNLEVRRKPYLIRSGASWEISSRKIAELSVDESTEEIVVCAFFKERTRMIDDFVPVKDLPARIYEPRKAIEIASEFFTTVVGRAPGGTAGVDYSITKRRGGYRGGEWLVSWPRFTKDGIQFHSDSSSVKLVDGKGAFVFSASFETEYPNSTKVSMTEAQALPVAMRVMKEKLKSAAVLKQLLPDGTVVEDKDKIRFRLLVVRPNDFFAATSTGSFVENPHGRVAWVLDALIKTPDREGSLSVYIDADTQECLGGDGGVLREFAK